MEGATSSAGSSKKATIYVGGFAPEVNEQQLLDAFVTFGECRCDSLSRATCDGARA
jgi:RNA recognition motif-containing protein